MLHALERTPDTTRLAPTAAAIGSSAAASFFRFSEGSTLDPAEIFTVLSGRRAGCMFRGAVAAETCRTVARNFWDADFIKIRAADAAGHYAGTYHFKKRLAAYLDEAEKSERDLPRLFDGTRNCFAAVLTALGEDLARRGIVLRQAMHDGRRAGSFLLRSLDPTRSIPLAAHEDVAQCHDERQRGFEIQKTRNGNVVAVNFCLENGEGGGELSYWNLRPHQEGRRALGLVGTGLPYPDAVLRGVEKIVMPIRPGDIYCFNGGYVHAVGAHPRARRSTISFFMGHIDPRTVVFWS
jgi:hypothetical protein